MKMIQRAGFDLLKGAIAAAAAFAGLVVGGIITAIIRLPKTGLPPQVDMKILLPWLYLSQIMIAILLGECFQELNQRYWQRLLSIWLCNYLLYYLLNALDGLLFSPLPNMGTGMFSSVFPALFMAAVIAMLWRPGNIEFPNIGKVHAYFKARKPADWAWRLVLAWLAFPPIYYLMGRAVAPFVQHYYEDPSLNLGLTMPPSVGALLAMQVLRGMLFLVAVLPIIVAWRGSQRGLWFWMGTVIFIQIAGQAILQAYWLPASLRIPHSLELLADSFLQAGLYTLLLSYSSKQVENQQL